jgi:hypothetical protein
LIEIHPLERLAPVLGLSVADPIRFVRADDPDAVLARHHAHPDPAGPVEVWVLPPLIVPPSEDALAAAAIVEHLASPNARVRHAARGTLAAAAVELGVGPAQPSS